MHLKDELTKLVELQRVDSQIYMLRHQRDVQIPTDLKLLKVEFESKKKNLERFENDLKQLLLKRKDKELELATKEDGVKKAQGHLYQLKTNKEYQAKLSEIASLKADISILEEGVIKILDDIGKAESDLKCERNRLAVEEKKLMEDENKINDVIKEIDVRLKNLEDKRNMLAKDIDKAILAKYEKLLQTRAGTAVAPVNNENCSACNMRITAQKINEIKMYKELIFCESCVRILYVPDEN